jgi:hypothetical protein
MTSHIRSREPGSRCVGRQVERDRGWLRFQRGAEVDRNSEDKKILRYKIKLGFNKQLGTGKVIRNQPVFRSRNCMQKQHLSIINYVTFIMYS